MKMSLRAGYDTTTLGPFPIQIMNISINGTQNKPCSIIILSNQLNTYTLSFLILWDKYIYIYVIFNYYQLIHEI